MSISFNELGLNNNIIDGLKKSSITIPTDIQKEVLPIALKNLDVIGCSQTGSGKTLAYLLPIFEKIDCSKREMQAIILAPTHELVMQIQREIELLSVNSELNLTSTAIIGEANINRQIEKLKTKPHIIVGSAGRILELIKKKKISAHTVKTIVIDEGDKLLDPNNLSVVKDVIKTTLKERQIMIFSASINEKTIEIAKSFTKEPKIITIENKITVGENIEHIYFETEQRDKILVLRKLIAAIKPKKAIVFINKRDEIEILEAKLNFHHISTFSLFGTASKEDRKKALENFRNGKIQILVASDLAARGLDIKGLTHVFNLDLPEDPKEYLHRAGRCGRNNLNGTSVSIVNKFEIAALKKYEKAFNIKIQEKAIFKGVIKDNINKPQKKTR